MNIRYHLQQYRFCTVVSSVGQLILFHQVVSFSVDIYIWTATSNPWSYPRRARFETGLYFMLMGSRLTLFNDSFTSASLSASRNIPLAIGLLTIAVMRSRDVPKVFLRSDVGMGSESQDLFGDCMIIFLISSELSGANYLNIGSVKLVLLVHGVCALMFAWNFLHILEILSIKTDWSHQLILCLISLVVALLCEEEKKEEKNGRIPFLPGQAYWWPSIIVCRKFRNMSLSCLFFSHLHSSFQHNLMDSAMSSLNQGMVFLNDLTFYGAWAPNPSLRDMLHRSRHLFRSREAVMMMLILCRMSFSKVGYLSGCFPIGNLLLVCCTIWLDYSKDDGVMVWENVYLA